MLSTLYSGGSQALSIGPPAPHQTGYHTKDHDILQRATTFQGHQKIYRHRYRSSSQISKDEWFSTHKISARALHQTFLREVHKTLQTSLTSRPPALIRASRHYCTSLSFPLSASDVRSTRPSSVAWLPNPAHLSFFAPGQGYSDETGARALP